MNIINSKLDCHAKSNIGKLYTNSDQLDYIRNNLMKVVLKSNTEIK